MFKGMHESVIKKGLKAASIEDHFLLKALFDRSFDSSARLI